jgi:hypothetical protein
MVSAAKICAVRIFYLAKKRLAVVAGITLLPFVKGPHYDGNQNQGSG